MQNPVAHEFSHFPSHTIAKHAGRRPPSSEAQMFFNYTKFTLYEICSLSPGVAPQVIIRRNGLL
jgi:hypothetical protein